MQGISRLGYLGFEVSDLDAWERFAVDVLGLAVAGRESDGAIVLRMDTQARRIILHPGPSDDLAYLGFEVDGDVELRAMTEELDEAGVGVREADPDQANERRVEALYQLHDPDGVPLELFHAPAESSEPFRSERLTSNFVTGDEGLGHALLVTEDAAAAERFYVERLGMKLSDYIEEEIAPGRSIRATFLHANPRHHSIALMEARPRKRIHHFMLEVESMADVGRAYDRALDAGVPIIHSLGQHPNDRMFSFYASTPSGFAVEFGSGGRKVDDATWQTCTYDRLSSWGHRRPGTTSK